MKTYVFQKGIRVQELSERKGYVDKFFDLGMDKAKGKSLKLDEPLLFESIEKIYDIRNEIAHGKHIKGIEPFKKMADDEIFDFIEDLIDDGEEVLIWINK